MFACRRTTTTSTPSVTARGPGGGWPSRRSPGTASDCRSQCGAPSAVSVSSSSSSSLSAGRNLEPVSVWTRFRCSRSRVLFPAAAAATDSSVLHRHFAFTHIVVDFISLCFGLKVSRRRAPLPRFCWEMGNFFISASSQQSYFLRDGPGTGLRSGCFQMGVGRW